MEFLMRNCSKRFALGLSFAFVAGLSASCSPEVGSDAWCEKMKETPKGDWSANDASAYAKNCILK